jgi:hydrogenase nickel incorporation protein HypA/HybF
LHEFSIASSIVETILDLADKQASSKVLQVHLKIGKLRAISAEQVAFSYNILAKGTILEGSQLTIEEPTGKLSCPNCNYHEEFDPEHDLSFHFGMPPLVCPNCNSTLEIQGGDECMITSVRMTVPSKEQNSEGSPSAEA